MLWSKLLTSLSFLGLCAYMVAGNSQEFCNEEGRITLTQPNENLFCQNLQTVCSTEQHGLLEHLHGTDVTLTCGLQSGPYTFWIRRANEERVEVNVSDPRITVVGNNGNMLQITNLQPEDEGEYRCTTPEGNLPQVLGCLTVIGLARFSECDNQGEFSYQNPPAVPNQDNSCFQSVTTTEGSELVFDTRLNFIGHGKCDCLEEITLLRLYKGQQLPMNQLYSCDETSTLNPCENKTGFEVRRPDMMDPYDFSLVIPLASMSDSGQYSLSIEVMPPGVSTVITFSKVFQVTVNPAPTTTTTTDPTSEPTTTPPTTTPTLPIVFTLDPNGIGIGSDSAASIGAGVAVPVVVILLVVIILVIVAVILLQRRQGSENIEPEKEKKPEPEYEVITDVHVRTKIPPAGNGEGNRESDIYFHTQVAVDFQLPTQHESADSLPV